MTLLPPDSQVLPAGSAMRWFVGDPNGARSSTWSIVGAVHTPEAFFSARPMMSSIKLSLHESMTRLAHTPHWWQQHAADPEADRLIRRWERTAPLAPGWRRVLQLIVPSSSLTAGLEEKPPKDGHLTCFPSPGPGWALQFEALISATSSNNAPAAELIVKDAIGEVGRMPLGGAHLWVVATLMQVGPDAEAELATWRANAQQAELNPDADPTQIRSWVWGTLHVDGTPSVIDLGTPG